MAISANDLRTTLRQWASGVTVVTTHAGEQQLGMTVSAFSSVCLEPPLILVSLHKESRLAQAVRESGVFAVSILQADQSALSNRFAGRVALADGEDRFDGVPTITAATGSPILDEALAWVDCRVYAVHDGISHWIVIGEVLATGTRDGDAGPLVYFDRDYREIARQVEGA